MVQLLIHGPPLWPQNSVGASAYPDEVFLIELQGTLETTDRGADGLDGQTMGTIEWPSDKSKAPVLKIGHHRLEGKLVPLPQPLAVIRKQDVEPTSDDEDEGGDTRMDVTPRARRRSGFGGLVGFTSSNPPSSSAITAPTSPTKDNSAPSAVNYDVLTLIRYKYLFKNRPEISISEGMKGLGSLIPGKKN